jgi:ubiquinone/menaquinone biosynthesis C-methylase UbiE
MDAASPWDREAATFDRGPDHGLLDDDVRAAWRELLLDHLPEVPARVADIGCGTGTLSVLLAREGYVLTGIDTSPRMLDRARAKARAAGVALGLGIGDAADPPLEDGAFDVVLCRHVLWLVDDVETTLRSWSRLLRTDGRFVLVEGRWATGAGLSSDLVTGALGRIGHGAVVRRLPDERLWGRPISDARYLAVSTPVAGARRAHVLRP